MTNMQNTPPGWEQPGPGQTPARGYTQPYTMVQPPYGAGYQPYQQAGWPGPTAQPVKTYLVPAILVTLFCFWPTGIAAIVFASQVSSKLSVGDYRGAVHASNQARLWTKVSLIVFGVLVVLGIAVAAMVVATSHSTVVSN
jgi:Interferon-induced transmembrane protein